MLTNTDMLFVSQEHDACAEAEENLQRLLGKKTDLEAHLQVSFRCAGFVLLAYCNWSTLCLTQKKIKNFTTLHIWINRVKQQNGVLI